MADPSDKQIDDIVSMLDEFMSQNGGHMNIQVKEDGAVKTHKAMAKTVIIAKSSDCAAGNLACHVPTLFEGMDHDGEDPENSETDFDGTFE